ncbi:sensor histidine kinase [Paenibacillus sp. LjRoot153]|uniref:cache domain-containing sensor histidine kinase n=1 Tax=Paenibacillus sp. LjRoot153 TaxID=3342270 RepID=UPI003ECF2FFA
MNIVKWFHNKLFSRIRLREKLFIMFFFVAIIPLLSFVYYSHQTIKRELTDQTYANMATSLEQINLNLESKLDAYSKISSTLYMDNILRAYLIRDYSEDMGLFVDAYQYFNNTIKNVLTTNPGIQSLTVYTRNQTLPADNVYIKRWDSKFEQSHVYLSLANTFGDIRFVTQQTESGGIPTITLARLLNYDKYPYGILTINIPESDIYSLMAQESEDKSIFIVDAEGNIISSKDKRMLNMNLKSFIRDEFSESLEGKFNDRFNGENVFVAYNTTKFGWKIVSVIPYQSFMAKAQAATARSLTIALLNIFLSALLIYTASRIFTKRVEYLLKMIRRVEKEDFNVNMKSLGHDEIGQLGFAFNKMAKRINKLITEVYKKEIDKKEAEMNVLQAQINPHFLYNTLASISSLAIQNGDMRINKMVADLAKFYRISLNNGKNVLSIHEEITLTRYYIAIQQVRFAGLLRVHYNIEETVLPCPIVKLSLQPLVENCINHAIWDDKQGINIVIKAYRDGQDIVLKVIDDGMGIPSDELKEDFKMSGYGVQNIDHRIKLTFGNDYGVTFFSKLGIGTAVQIRIPG